MHSKSVQEGDSVPIRSDAGMLMELQYLHEQCQGERRSQVHGIQVASAAKELCLWKQMLCIPRYLDSELQEIAEINLFYWFKGLFKSLKKH